MFLFICKILHELFSKVRPRIFQLHRNMLKALFKVNMFDTLLKFGLSISIFYHQIDDMTLMKKLLIVYLFLCLCNYAVK